MLSETVKLALTTLVVWRLLVIAGNVRRCYGRSVLACNKHTVWLAVVSGLFGSRVMLRCMRFVMPCQCTSPPWRGMEWWCPRHRKVCRP